ncbi:TonB-dependent receptor [Steroidobacter agaridevorans]|uniref:TonB-dependent receptor n=1 Tax=Steroidobacter agaridevorans TaxID=2695856 RepID=A0A829Y666_9GAMM|nr:TonB-dependent receptor [Steroidobacter agaridevorans]GFE89333.1 TonB-dependent receptor [Steroidobacter agaridevorans]
MGVAIMSKSGRHGSIRVAVRTVLGVAALSASAAAFSQQAAQAPQQEGALEEVIVTGFKESLSLALDQKREAVGAVDAIVAEDIADFPDLNLAESIQRVPGVSIARDAGEGRNISVRGLGPQFTRVRINGMEAMSANGGTDAAGGTNRDRSFDFNTFASELFNSITIRKTSAAEVEEGSLGATVDLRSGRPFDYDGFTVVTSAQASYNDIQEDVDPRGAFLISNTFADGRFGALFSVAYSERKLLDEGSSTVRWQAGPTGAFVPRIPRYDIYKHDQERLGLTGSLQWAPTDKTTISLDALHAKFEAQRDEIFLEAPGFSGNNAGSAAMTVRESVVDDSNTIVYGVFDNVDIRSEARHDELETDFTHLTLEGTHEFTDRVRFKGLVGYSEAKHDNPIQTTLLFDRNDVDGYTYDFRGNDRLPQITYGDVDVTDPASWRLSQIRLRPQSSENTFKTVSFDVAWDVTDVVTLKAGPQYKKFEFDTTALVRSNGTTGNQENQLPGIPATAVGPYSELVSISNNLNVANGTPTTWLIPDIDAVASQFGIYDRSRFPLGIEPALANNYNIEEEDTGGYLQADFNTFLFDRPLRANVGVRYVETKQTSSGYTFTAGAPLLTTVERTYSDTLPSLNVALDVTDQFVVRASAAKVMVRPNGGGGTAGLGILAPGAAVTASTASLKTVSAGNPNLDPYRAKAYDLSFEWYFAEDSLLSLALFMKDIDSFVQIIRATDDFQNNPLGLPDSVALAACGTVIPDAAECLAGWQFSLPTNTDGGDLKGFEISYQQPFSFLPGFWSNFGLILNYTGVESEIEYLSQTGALAAKEDLTGLSKSAYNATLYWENEKFSARVSAAYRDEFLTTVPGRNGNDVEGTADTMTIDASSSFTVNDNLTLTLEALNLTDQFQDQYVDSTGDRLSYYHHQGRQYLLGARYKF